MGHHLPVGDLTNGRREVDQDGGGVKPPTPLRCLIVTREDVVVVVETLTDGTKCDKKVLCGVDVLVVRFVAKEMCHRIYTPGGVQ